MSEATGGLVLIVDDEPDLVSAMSQLLTGFGFEVLVAHNGQEALACYEQNHDKVSLILCDISMPEMDGLEFFKKGLAKFGTMPIVMVTGHGDVPRVTEAVRLGAIDYLVKPFTAQNLESQLYVWQEVARRRRDSLNNTPGGKMEGLLRLRNSELRKKRGAS